MPAMGTTAAAASTTEKHRRHDAEVGLVQKVERELTDVRDKSADTTVDEYLGTEPQDESLKFRWKLAVFMHTGAFETALGCALMANALFLAVELDYDSTAIDVVGFVFLVGFVIELSLRMYGLGILFFHTKANVFDLVIVCVGVISEIITQTSDWDGSTIFTVFRLMRLLRVLRLFNTFKALNVIVQSFAKAIHGVFWVLVMLILVVYMFSLFARSFIGQNPDFAASSAISRQLFGSVFLSFVTMMQMITLDSWTSGITRPILELDGDPASKAFPSTWWTYMFFLFYTLLTAFGVLNLLTAVFVNALLDATEERKQEEAKKRRAEKLLNVGELEKLFASIDIDGTGMLGMEEVENATLEFMNPKWSSLFKKLELAPGKLAKLMLLFASDTSEEEGNSGEFSYQDFLAFFSDMDEDTVQNGQWEVEAAIVQLKQKIDDMEEMIRSIAACTPGAKVIQPPGVKSKTPQLNPQVAQKMGVANGSISPLSPAHMGLPSPVAAVNTLKKSTVDEHIAKMFTRYDLDGSGTINSPDELRQLVYNLAFKLELQRPEVDVAEILENLPSVSDYHAMDQAAFTHWFTAVVLCKMTLI